MFTFALYCYPTMAYRTLRQFNCSWCRKTSPVDLTYADDYDKWNRPQLPEGWFVSADDPFVFACSIPCRGAWERSCELIVQFDILRRGDSLSVEFEMFSRFGVGWRTQLAPAHDCDRFNAYGIRYDRSSTNYFERLRQELSDLRKIAEDATIIFVQDGILTEDPPTQILRLRELQRGASGTTAVHRLSFDSRPEYEGWFRASFLGWTNPTLISFRIDRIEEELRLLFPKKP